MLQTKNLMDSLEKRMIDSQNAMFERFLKDTKSSAPKKTLDILPLNHPPAVSQSSAASVKSQGSSSNQSQSQSANLGLLGSDQDSDSSVDDNGPTPLANKLSSGESSYDWDCLGTKDQLQISHGSVWIQKLYKVQ